MTDLYADAPVLPAGEKPGTSQYPADLYSEPLPNSPTITPEEAAVLGELNSDTQPDHLGLIGFPKDVAAGIGNSLLSVPHDVGATLLEMGELSRDIAGQDVMDVAKKSVTLRLADYAKQSKTPNLWETAKILWGVEKDVLLSGVSETKVPQALQDAGNAMMKHNEAALAAMGMAPKDSFAFDIGTGAGSVFKSLGLYYMTGNPTAAETYMFWTVNSNDYLEARQAGLSPEDAAYGAFTSAAGQAKLEGLGLNVFGALGEAGGFIKKTLFRAAEQSVEEMTQAVWEEGVKQVHGIRNTPFEEKLTNVLLQGAIGFIVGAPTSAVISVMESAAKQNGINADKQIKAFSKNGDMVVNGFAEVLHRSEFTSTEKNREKVKEAVAPIMAAQQEGAAEKKPTQQTPQEQQVAQEDTALAESLALEEKQLTKISEAKDKWAETTMQYRQAAALTKEQVKEAQSRIIDYLNESQLEAADKAKFLVTIRDTQTATQLVNKIDEITAKVDELVDTSKRRTIAARLKKTLRQVQNSGVMAVDIAKRVEEKINKIDLTERKPQTIKELKATREFMQKNPSAQMPKDVLKKLEILDKTPIAKISTPDLEALMADIENAVNQAKVKHQLQESRKQKEIQKALDDLAKDSKPISRIDPVKSPLEAASALDNFKQRVVDRLNSAKEVALNMNPMDVVFDMLDGLKNYTGANYRIFKKEADASYSKYLDLKDSIVGDVVKLWDKLNLEEHNLNRIGVWAALQQEGGRKKLTDTGFTDAEIDSVSLTPEEMKMYLLMREKLDSMFDGIRDVMRRVYNQDVEAVQNYFSFTTDFDAMDDLEVQDTLGPQAPQRNRKNVERGFTISRTGGTQKIKIDAMEVFMKHVDNAAYLIEMGETIKRLGDIASSDSYRESVGDIGQHAVKQWVNILARNGRVKGHTPALDVLRKNVGIATLGFKVSSIVVQPTALADGAALVGGNYVSKGVVDITKSEWRKFLWDNMPEFRARTGDDPAFLDLGGNKTINKIQEAGYWAMKKADAMTAGAIAIGAYRSAVEAKGGVVDLNMPDAEAIQEAQRIMRRTQSSALAKDVPAVISRGGLTGNVSLDKIIFQFQSFMLNRWSLWKHDMWALGVKQGNTAQALNIATWLIIANVAELGLRRMAKELMAALFDNKIKKWEKTIDKEVAQTVLGNVPFVSQVADIYGYGSVPVPAISSLGRIADEISLAGKSKSNRKQEAHMARAAILTTGILLGLPGTVQLEQIVKESTKR